MNIRGADDNLFSHLVQDARIHGGVRVFRDEQPFTDEGKAMVIVRCQEYLKRTKRSAEYMARSLGITSSVVSQVLSGTYAADSEKHIRAIDKWLENQLMRESTPKLPGFVMTGVAERIYGAVRWVMKTNTIGLVCGPNGCGKTMTLKAIQSETPGAVYYSIGTSGTSKRAVLEGLAGALRMTGLRLATSQLFEQVVLLLKDTSRTIFIDEIHKLAGRQKDEPLHMLRDLHDATGCPMIWAGNCKIIKYLRDNKTDGNDPIDQIYGRISWCLDLTDLATSDGAGDGSRLCTVADIQKLFAAQKIRLTPDAAEYLSDIASDLSEGCYRWAKFLVSMAQFMAKDGVITAEMLKAIQVQRLGRRVAGLVETKVRDRMLAATA